MRAGDPDRLRYLRCMGGPLVAAVVVLVFFADVWAPSRVFVSGDSMAHLPLRAALGRAASKPRLFLWNPDLFAGYPPFADINAAPLYPLSTLWFFLLQPVRAFVAATVIHYVIAALLTAAFLRRIGVGTAGAIVGALGFALGTSLVAHLQHLNILGSAVWLPLVLWAVEDSVEGRSRSALWKGALGTMLFWLGGHPEIAVYGGITVFVYAAVRAAQARRLRVLAAVAAFGALGTVMAAVQLIPVWELVSQSKRSAGPAHFTLGDPLLPQGLATLVSPYVLGGPKWGLPDSVPWGRTSFLETACYVGVPTLALALLALASRDQRRWPLGLTALFALLMALGRYVPLLSWTADLPPFCYFRGPARWVIPFSFSLACLAGIGLDGILDPQNREAQFRRLRYGWIAFALGIAAVLIANLLLFVFPDLTRDLTWRWIETARLGRGAAHGAEWYRQALDAEWLPSLRAVAWIFGPVTGIPLAFAALTLAALTYALRGDRRVAGAILVVLVISDLWLQNHGLDLNVTAPARFVEQPPATVEYLRSAADGGRSERIYTWWGGGGTGPGESAEALAQALEEGRVEKWFSAAKEMMPLDLAALYGVPNFRAHNPIWLAVQERACAEIEGERPKRLAWAERFQRLRDAVVLLRLSSIRYLLSPVEIPDSGIEERFRNKVLDGDLAVRVYEVPGALPKAYWTSGLRTVASEEILWSELRQPAFDPHREALIVASHHYGWPDGDGGIPGPSENGEVRLVEETPTRSTYRVSAKTPGFLVINQSYYPGWSAVVNGREERIFPANAMFQGLQLPAGESSVVVSYHPRSLFRGAAISLVGLIAALGATACMRRS